MRMWPRRPPEEPAISRDDVLAIIGALADIKAWTHDIRQHLLDDDEEEEADT